MATQCEILQSDPLAAAEPVSLPGEWRYCLGAMLVMLGALSLLAVLADEALGGGVLEVMLVLIGV